MDNGGGAFRGVYLQGNEAVSPIFEAWMKPFASLGMSTLTIRPTSGTDHLSFDAVGLPGFQFVQDPLEYRSRTHHTNLDVYERAIPDDLVQNAIIDRDVRLPRREPRTAAAAQAAAEAAAGDDPGPAPGDDAAADRGRFGAALAPALTGDGRPRSSPVESHPASVSSQSSARDPTRVAMRASNLASGRCSTGAPGPLTHASIEPQARRHSARHA